MELTIARLKTLKIAAPDKSWSITCAAVEDHSFVENESLVVGAVQRLSDKAKIICTTIRHILQPDELLARLAASFYVLAQNLVFVVLELEHIVWAALIVGLV